MSKINFVITYLYSVIDLRDELKVQGGEEILGALAWIMLQQHSNKIYIINSCEVDNFQHCFLPSLRLLSNIIGNFDIF